MTDRIGFDEELPRVTGTRARRRGRRRLRRRTGAAMVVAGLALLGLVAYQLWGTGLATSRAQASFRRDISAHGYPRKLREGREIGLIRIPRIGLEMAFVEGANWWTLERGPGHYRSTPLPGQSGNVAIAGHRTTFLHPFWSLNRVGPGDLIDLQTRAGRFVYRVVWQKVVPPGSLWVIGPTARPSLTLTTCTPRFSAADRLVVRAVQVSGPSPAGMAESG